MKAKNSRANMTHFVSHSDAGEDTHAEEGDLLTRQRRHDIVQEFMTMRTCFARVFTQAAPVVVRKPSRNAWGVSLIACLLCVSETALAQGGNIGEGPGWMPVLLGIWLGLALIFGTFSVVPLILLKRRNQSFGLKKAVTGAYLLPLFSTVVAFLVALDRIDSSFIMFLATIGVIQLIYTGMFWLPEIKHVYTHLRKEGNKKGRRRTTIWLLLGAIALLLLGIVLYLSSRDIGPFHDQTAATYTNRGIASFDKGDYDAAIKEYTQAITLNPEYAVAYYNRGIAYDKKGDYDAALKDYTQAITLNPEYADAYNNRGNAYYAKGDYDAAIKDYTQAITLNPEYAGAYYNRGYVYYDKGEYDRAIADYTQVMTLNPEDADAYTGLGNALSAQGKYDEAMTNYRKALELDPDYASAYNGLGLALSAQGKYDEAMTNYRKALELDPDYVYAYNNLGNALSAQGKYDEAITNYRKALELDPNPVRKANLAELYLVAGHVQEAVSLSKEMLQDPQSDTDHMLAMRFNCLAALLMQGNQADALAERQDLITYYQGLATEYERGWGYGFVKNFLNATDNLTETDKTLLFKLIEILEAPKPEGDQKLKEFEAWLATLPQQE